MSSVRIVNCGVPPRGWQVEYGVEVDGSVVSKSQGSPLGNIVQTAEREALAIGQRHYMNERGVRVQITAKLGEIRGPFPSSPSNPMGFCCMVMGPNEGWVPFHGYTSGDALRDAKAYSSSLVQSKAV